MSVSLVQQNGSDLPAAQRKRLTYREARYVAARINGLDMTNAARKAGFSESVCLQAGARIETGVVEAALHEAQEILANHALAEGLIDAAEIHEYLTDALRARMSDIRNDDHSFKPRSEWPEIWDRLEEGGEVEISYEHERSHDGKDEDKRGGWDTVGKVLDVKCKFPSKVKLLELAMKHKGVDAMVQQKGTEVNVLVVSAEKARQVQGARKRLAKVVDVTPENTTGSRGHESTTSARLLENQQRDDPNK
jgi:phage terminase small subunit